MVPAGLSMMFIAPLPGRDTVCIFKCAGKMKLVLVSDGISHIGDGQGGKL